MRKKWRPSLGPNPKHKLQVSQSENEEGNDEKKGKLRYKTGDKGSKCKVNQKGMRCLYTNAQSMRNKQDELLKTGTILLLLLKVGGMEHILITERQTLQLVRD